MLATYYDIITNIENFVDGLMIVDEKGIIVYNKQFSKTEFEIDESESVGKTPMDVFQNLDPETSTCYRALRYGETTINQLQTLERNGSVITVLDNTFPIIENGKIIGAVSTSKYVSDANTKNSIDLSNMTSSKKSDLYVLDDIIGESDAVRNLKYKIHKIAQSDVSVLIYGETGTGKELVAQAIHSHSARRDEYFISQNCAAIPQNLLESIFFGTTKGSFTGAVNKPGIFERANGGTIFLDEMNSMDLNMQAKLLKAIEEKKITRVGGGETKRIDVRIIAAINKSPTDCVREHIIREDLYYRLSSITVNLKPLRERGTDVLILSEHFIREKNKSHSHKITHLSDEVKQLFKEYSWPGNIRELKNVIESAFVFSSSETLQMKDLPEVLQASLETHASPQENVTLHRNEDMPLADAVDAYERAFILSHADNIRSLADLAKRLGITRQALNYKIKKYDLSFPELEK